MNRIGALTQRTVALLVCTVVLWGSTAASADRLRRHPKTFAVGPNPCAIAACDMGGDGIPEIVTADRGVLTDPREERPANDELSLLHAEVSLEYKKQQPSLKSGFAPYDITFANIDAYKWPDIVVACFQAVRNRDLAVFLNIKQEGLLKPVMFRVPNDPLSYHRHVDGDGAELFTTPALTSVAVRELTGDGLRDLMATAWSSDVLVFMPGHLEEIFGEPSFIEAPGGPRDLVIADLDQDGLDDVAVAMYVSGEVALYRGLGEGRFEAAGRFLSRGQLPSKIAAADMNGDGALDLIVSHSHADDSVVVFYGEGDFRFSASQELMLGERRDVLEKEIRDIVVDDFNKDGHMDIAAACFAAGEVWVLWGKGDGEASKGFPSFDREHYVFEEGSPRTRGKPRALCSADFNDDGKPDLAVALWDLNAVGLLLSQD